VCSSDLSAVALVVDDDSSTPATRFVVSPSVSKDVMEDTYGINTFR